MENNGVFSGWNSLVFLQPDGRIALYEIQVYLVT